MFRPRGRLLPPCLDLPSSFRARCAPRQQRSCLATCQNKACHG